MIGSIFRVFRVLRFSWRYYDAIHDVMAAVDNMDAARRQPPGTDELVNPGEPSGLVLTFVLALLMMLTILAIFLGCNVPAHAQLFHGQSDQPTPVVSVFANSLPIVQPGHMLVQGHLYTACIDPDAKQPVWIAYTVQRSSWETGNVLSRNFHTPKRLQPFCLEQSDYAGSGYELGHLYGLQFVSAEPYASEVNELTVIAAQRPGLNKGPWLAAENRIKKSSETQPVKVLAGQLWHTAMPPLVNADEPHKIASHCWIIFDPGPDGTAEAYKIPQTVERSADLKSFAIKPAHLREEISTTWTQSF